MKSLRSTGTDTSARTASRSASEPPKRRCSVSTLIAAAPPAAYSAASLAGSGMSASAPLLGLRRFTSAMIDTPSARKPGSGSRAGGASATRDRSSSSGISLCRWARSASTPSRIPSSTVVMPSSLSVDDAVGRYLNYTYSSLKEAGMRTWFVTGASRGFGFEIARQALELGDNVVATARRPGTIVADLPSERLLALPLDVSDEDAARQAVEAAVDRFCGIDVLVNNAGRGLLGAVEEAADAEVR